MKFLNNDEFVELIDSYCEGGISLESLEHLQDILKTDEDSLKFYINYLNVRQGAAAVKNIDNSTNPGAALITKMPTLTKGFVSLSVMCILVAAALIMWQVVANGKSSEHAENSPAGPQDTPSKVVYLGEVVNVSSDVVWAEGSSVNDFLCRVKAGDRIEISSGLVQVDYYAGASLIIRAPSAFVVVGPESGMIERGELTGMVSEGDFTLTTPGAKVLDLGTEFGVVVDHLNNTDVCVLEGKVELSTLPRVDGSKSTLLLSEGMSARVNDGGIAALDSSMEVRFSRKMSAKKVSSEEVSLLDVFAGYEPLTPHIGMAVSPETGYHLEESALKKRGLEGLVQPNSEDVYRAATWHPLLDGIFIPNAGGQDVQTDSSGTRIELPPNEGKTSGPVWARRNIGTPEFIFNKHFWGGQTRKSVLRFLKKSRQGLMGVHSNVGITFDLDAIEKHYGRRATNFSSLVANLDNKDDWEPDRTDLSKADIRILVDGKLLASRLGFRKSDGEKQINVPLPPEGRFLTIITTDCGAISYDQVVLIDPVIEFN